MKAELNDKLVEILTSIQVATGKAADFAIEQLPDIAVSYIAYGRALYSIVMLFGLVAMCLSVWGWFRYSKNGQDVHFALGLFCGVIGLAAFVTNLSSALMVWFAPKVWLLKEIANLVR